MNKKGTFWFVPNTITSFNVLSGCLSVVFAFEGQLVLAGLFILIAAVFDFFDGFAARMLNAYSEMGKQLDSLADMLSFGFAPAVIAFQLIKLNIAPDSSIIDLALGQKIIILFPFIIAIFSALRLAKFNIDTRQTDSFIGLPTPANAMIWASMPFILAFQSDSFFANIFSNTYVLLALSLVMSFALIMGMPLFSLKFKNFSWTDNKIRFIFLAICLILIIAFGFSSIPLIIISYILVSLF